MVDLINQLPLPHPHQNTQHTTKTNENMATKVCHHLRPSSGFNLVGGSNQLSQHDNIIFIGQTNYFFFIINYFITGNSTVSRRAKGEFCKLLNVLFLFLWIHMMHTNLFYLEICFLPKLHLSSLSFLAWFQPGAGVAMVTMFWGS